MGIRGNKIAMKNYIIYAAIVIVTIVLLLYFRTWYRTYKTHLLTIPVINGYLSEVKYEELDNYILENPDFTLYMCTTDEDKCRDFEKDFKKTVKKYNLKDQMIYLNLNDYVKNNNKTLLDTKMGVSKVMKQETFFSSYPSISIFKDKELYDILIINGGVDMDDVIQFLEEHEVILEQ